MTLHRLAPLAVDWRRPWFAPLAPWGRAAEALCERGEPVHAALNALGAAAIRFAPQSALPAGTAYEAHIHAEGQVPTRDNAHDFFAGLIWQAFPQAKRRLNAIHAQAIASAGVQAHRGPVRDGATLLDENGALLACDDALWQALAQRRWKDAFITHRTLWQSAQLWLFGHAALEKLQAPYKSITAHVLRLPRGSAATLAQADAVLSSLLSADVLASKPFVPLPVLGVPGWWAGNEDPAFYEDAGVFRPALR